MSTAHRRLRMGEGQHVSRISDIFTLYSSVFKKKSVSVTDARNCNYIADGRE